jgi:hypothetical protein
MEFQRERERKRETTYSLQGVPKVSRTFVFVISFQSLAAQNKFLCQIEEEIWGIFLETTLK